MINNNSTEQFRKSTKGTVIAYNKSNSLLIHFAVDFVHAV